MHAHIPPTRPVRVGYLRSSLTLAPHLLPQLTCRRTIWLTNGYGTTGLRACMGRSKKSQLHLHGPDLGETPSRRGSDVLVSLGRRRFIWVAGLGVRASE